MVQPVHDNGNASADIGRWGGRQSLNLPSWADKRVALHELLHALGFRHEHQRPDRDKYVEINPSSNPNNLTIIESIDVRTSPYDYESIMHYEGIKMLGTDNRYKSTSRNAYLSASDIKMINRFYPKTVQGPQLIPNKVVLRPPRSNESAEFVVVLKPGTYSLSPAGLKKVIAKGIESSHEFQPNGDVHFFIKPKPGFIGAASLSLGMLLDYQQFDYHDHEGNWQWLKLPIDVIGKNDFRQLSRVRQSKNPVDLGRRATTSRPVVKSSDPKSSDPKSSGPAQPGRQLVSIAGKQCLEALDDRNSWFWRHAERTVGVRTCEKANEAQRWEYKEEKLVNVRYPRMCLGKTQWTHPRLLSAQERGYAALESCTDADDQKWVFKTIHQLSHNASNLSWLLQDDTFILNLGEPKLSLLQGNGTVVVEEGAAQALDDAVESNDQFVKHYLWRWQ